MDSKKALDETDCGRLSSPLRLLLCYLLDNGAFLLTWKGKAGCVHLTYPRGQSALPQMSPAQVQSSK